MNVGKKGKIKHKSSNPPSRMTQALSSSQLRTPATQPSTIRPDEISELKTKMQAILFSIGDGIVMTDFDGNILVINDLAKKMLGIQKKFPYEKKFLDYVANESVRESLASILESGEETCTTEIKVSTESGENFILTTKNPVTSAHGDVLGRVIALRDITLEKQIETMKDDFVHSITHDLKSPLTSIQGYIDLFLGGDTGDINEDQRHHLEVMDLSTKKLSNLINNMLDMAKLEAGKMKIDKEPWDVSKAVYHIIETVHAIAIQGRIRIVQKIESAQGSVLEVVPGQASESRPELPEVSAWVDGTLMERAISNLLDNALKFTRPDGLITIKVQDQPDRVRISVSDTGVGISEDSLDKVFVKFKQLSDSKGGTGLGLTITKHIVEEHGGQITVTSKLKQGTTFEFWVPKSG